MAGRGAIGTRVTLWAASSHKLAGAADVDRAVDQPAERSDRVEQLGILVRPELTARSK
jgi:hypothetical protein